MSLNETFLREKVALLKIQRVIGKTPVLTFKEETVLKLFWKHVKKLMTKKRKLSLFHTVVHVFSAFRRPPKLSDRWNNKTWFTWFVAFTFLNFVGVFWYWVFVKNRKFFLPSSLVWASMYFCCVSPITRVVKKMNKIPLDCFLNF